MRIRYIVAGVLCLGLIGLFCWSAYVDQLVREQWSLGIRRGKWAQMLVDIGMWWSSYGWVVVIAAGQLLLVFCIGRGLHRAYVKQRCSLESRDFEEGKFGSLLDGQTSQAPLSDS